MLNFKTSTIAVTLAVASIGVFAQAAVEPATPRADKRESKQQERISQGAASGQLNAKETNRLEKQQGAVNKAEDKAKADGTVTAQERKRVHRLQEKTSKNIHQQKHDEQVAPKP